ncbi:hypothetical protein D9M72_557020 [compost metagenome]
MTGLSSRARKIGTEASRMTPAPTMKGRMPSLPRIENNSGPVRKPSDRNVP